MVNLKNIYRSAPVRILRSEFQDTPVSSGGRSISSYLRSETSDCSSDGPWHGLFLNLIFEGGQSGQDLSLVIFLSLLLILGVEIFIGSSPKLETVVGSKHERIKFIWITKSSTIVI